MREGLITGFEVLGPLEATARGLTWYARTAANAVGRLPDQVAEALPAQVCVRPDEFTSAEGSVRLGSEWPHVVRLVRAATTR